jgi:hypothetical protein
VKIKIKWIKQKQMTHENTYRDNNDDCKLNLYVSLIMTLICLDPCQWTLMSLITGNKVKKNTQAKVLRTKEKDKDNKRILRSLSFDNNG